MNKKIIAGLVSCLFASSGSANDQRCAEGQYCTPLAQPGNALMSSRVLTRDVGQTPPNAEYRKPDEVIVVSDLPKQDTVEYEDKRVMETQLRQETAGNIQYPSGENALSAKEREQLTALAQRLQGKPGLRLAIIGHADEQRLSARKKAIYGDNQGLSEARAREAAAYLNAQQGWSDVAIATRGMGDREPQVQCDRNAPLDTYQACMAPNRRIEIQVWYDQVTERVEQVARAVPAVPPTPVECHRATGTDDGLPFRISVDGEPLVDTDKPNSADVTRCTDVALEHSDIQIRYDAMESTPWLNVSAFPNAALRNKPVRFTTYNNYAYWIEHGEVRVFDEKSSPQATPLAIIPLDANGQAEWIPDMHAGTAVKYVVRVYDRKGRFDETIPQPLAVAEKPDVLAKESQRREELVGYGENRLSLHNIPVEGGAVTANGTQLQPGQRVRFLGQEIPVDKNGKFAARQILPSGNHVVGLQVLDADGVEVMGFNRDLNIPEKDLFYVAMADLTAGRNSTTGPANLVTGDTQHFDNKGYVDGRLAFYLKDKLENGWTLTAAADTQEQPLKSLFSNFDSKDPNYLLRRLNPDLFYPTYGDDSTTIEDAPTSGKFFVKLARGDSHVMWGNFQTQLPGSDLIQYSRGMYGAGLKWRGDESTTFGQKKTQVDGFAGDPGTLGARDEFRGTGGSLYYVQHQDVTRGSDHLWVEVRDYYSGIVLNVTQLTAGQDYDFDPLQGRILLRTPLPSTADDSQLVRAGSLSGQPVFLVATYEYVPGVTEISNMTLGGRASQWVNDKVQVGVTGYRQGNVANRQELIGADVTYRVSPGVYVKAETARSDGAGTTTQSSATGGILFNSVTSPGGVATANRVEAAVDLAELDVGKGKLNAYWQDREKGFSSPGQITAESIQQAGLGADIAITDDTRVIAKADIKDATSQNTQALSTTVKHQMTPNWAASVGVRYDDLNTYIANASPTLSQNGSRTDLGVQLDYNPNPASAKPDWKAYGFAQGTLENTGNRNDNSRAGAGGSWRLNDRINLLGEVSDGAGGIGGKAGADWQVDDRSQLYMNYAMDTDRTDSLYRGRQGTLVTGSKTRYTDDLSVYSEERMTQGVGPSGLLHAFGLDLAARDGWNFGAKAETGKITDPVSGDFDHKALSFSVGRAIDKIKYAGNLEWRDETGATLGERTTWLMRNSLGYQISPDWRLISKLNFSVSSGSTNAATTGDFTEAVLGYAYRPVMNDKLNALFKYTYFYNQPSAGALTASALGSGTASSYEQKSQILSVDAIYDIRPWLSIGGKYGYRSSDVRDTSTGGLGSWQNADAHLVVGRLDWHFVHEWDALAEMRWLDVPAAKDSRAGALVGVYRHINKNVKAGVGYNFTDFSDDLTNMSYRSRGWFVNVLSEF
jgi:outer membrane protein OmpA-like peptidoglycan-associated protein